MLVAILIGHQLEQLYRSALSLPDEVGMVELRLDHLNTLCIDSLGDLIKRLPQEVLLTLRSHKQGGLFDQGDAEQVALLHRLAKLDGDYLDLEYQIENATVTVIGQACGNTRLLRSYHHLSATPRNLQQCLIKMQHPAVDQYKLVTTAQNTLDSLRMLDFVSTHAGRYPLTAHAMGEAGLVSRLLGKRCGSRWLFTAGEDHSHPPAPGCPKLSTLLQRYRAERIDANTQAFGLIGMPVTHSIGDRWHNRYFATHGHNAIYLKMPLTPEQLPEFFRSAPQFFSGLSVTTPLKTAVMPYVTHNPLQLAACNTLCFKHGEVLATHTDGQGIITTLPKVAPKRLLLIGAGGAAAGILPSLRQTLGDSCITISNRSLDKAKALTDNIGVQVAHINALDGPFDVVINTLPNSQAADGWLLDHLPTLINDQSQWINLDYSHPRSDLLAALEAHQATLIRGEKVFAGQALAQQHWWSI